MAKQKTNPSAGLLEGMNVDPSETPQEPVETTVDSNPTPQIPDNTDDVGQTTESTTEPAAQQTAAGSADASAAAVYLDRIKQLGFENVETEQDALDRLVESYAQQQRQMDQLRQQIQQAAPFVNYGQQYIQQLQDPAFVQFQQQRQSPRQPVQQQQQEDPTKWWSPPSYDPALVQKYQDIAVGADGVPRTEWKPNTPAELRAAVESHQAYREKWAEQLVSNPQQALAPFKGEVLAEVRRMFDDVLGTTERERETQTLAERIKNENQEWMYERDPRTGSFLADPVSGDPVLSNEGRAALQMVARAEQVGITDPYEQWNYAVAMMHARNPQQAPVAAQAPAASPVPQQTTAQVADDKKKQLLSRGRPSTNGANSIPSRGGSNPPAESPARKTSAQNKNISPGAQLISEMRRNGVAV